MAVTRLPRLLDAETLAARGRLRPERLTLDLKLEPLSSARMVLPPGEGPVAPGDFIELFSPEGGCGIFRVKETETDARGRQDVRLLHGLCTLGDHLVFEEKAYQGLETDGDTGKTLWQGTVQSRHAYIRAGKGRGDLLAVALEGDTVAITGASGGWYAVNYASVHGWVAKHSILNSGEPVLTLPEVILDLLDTQQPWSARRWTLGTVEPLEHCGTVLAQVDTLKALLSLPALTETPCMWTFDQSVTPWELGLRTLPDTVRCELRPARGLTEVTVTEDRDSLCTRIYPVGKDGLTIADVNEGGLYLSSGTEETWGIAERIWSDPDEQSASALMRKAEHAMAALCEPTLSVRLSMAREEGHVPAPGDLCRLVLPDRVLTRRVTRLQWADALHEPDRLTLTLSAEPVTMTSLIGTGGGGKVV